MAHLDQGEKIAQDFANNVEPCIHLKAVRRPTGILDSKFGGTPYLPPGFTYPINENPNGNRTPLRLLAQLNFATLPKVDWLESARFPNHGILQFYIPDDENKDVYGADFDNPGNQAGFRVIYHENVIEDPSQWSHPPKLATRETSYFPFRGEFALEPTVGSMPMSPYDFRFDQAFEAHVAGHIPPDQLVAMREAVKEYLRDNYNWTGHRIGGGPFFTQEDPREYGPHGEVVAGQMLLQIDSGGDEPNEICWGDHGVANFFVGESQSPTENPGFDLSTVIYTWDCF
ncbi:MAG: DUF1963 domain-containing protein [Propionibacteriaceae bacterium]|nr:DUF1963 domain-containing protein [Propionibacteriaceae bacterium]